MKKNKILVTARVSNESTYGNFSRKIYDFLFFYLSYKIFKYTFFDKNIQIFKIIRILSFLKTLFSKRYIMYRFENNVCRYLNDLISSTLIYYNVNIIQKINNYKKRSYLIFGYKSNYDFYQIRNYKHNKQIKMLKLMKLFNIYLLIKIFNLCTINN